MKAFILELGSDFIFMGEQFRLQVGNQDFYIDLLFYHRGLSALVAFELKIGKFSPEHMGQLSFYLEALDRDVKKPHENPSIGVLLCCDKDDEVVEYPFPLHLSTAGDFKNRLRPLVKFQPVRLVNFIPVSTGWAIDDHMRTSLCVKALQMAFWRRKPPPGLLHHSDRGSQYASREYRQHLAVMKVEQSMSRKGNCWDNSPTERFFRSLKHEQLNYEKFKTQEAAKLSVIDYLAFYNGRRPHSTLGYQSPVEFEREFSRDAV